MRGERSVILLKERPRDSRRVKFRRGERSEMRLLSRVSNLSSVKFDRESIFVML